MARVASFEFATDDVRTLLSPEDLGSAKVDATPVSLALKPPAVKIEGAELVVTGGAELSVQALNSVDDQDADGVWQGKAPKDQDDAALPAFLTLSSAEAWLKYRISGTLKAKLAGSLGAAGFELGGEGGVVLADYRVHSRAQLVRDAFLADVVPLPGAGASPRLAFDLADVTALAEHEAVAFQARGQLGAKVSLSFGDLFTGQASALLSLAGVTQSIGFTVKAGASVDFAISVSDEFIVTFARIDTNAWRFGVRKARTSQADLSVAAKIEVAAADPKAFNAFLNEIKKALIGEALADVKALTDKAKLDDLSDVQKQLLQTLLGRFGLNGATDPLAAVRARVEKIDKEIGAVLEQVAKSKVTLGFAYEYSRVKETVELLQGVVDAARLQQLHGDVVRGRLAGPLDAFNSARPDDPGLKLETYLNQTTLKRERSWGFSLGIGKWVDIGGKDFDKLRAVTRRHQTGAVQESYLGTRGYQGRWIGETLTWSVDFRAEMRGYSQKPTLRDFDLGLHLAFEATQDRLSASEIDLYLDFASVWGIVTPEQVAERRAQLREFEGTAQIVSIQMTVPDEAFKILLPALAVLPDADFAAALAAGMARRDDTIGLRTPGERIATFSEAWALCLAEPDLNSTDRRRVLADLLRKRGRPDLAQSEDQSVGASTNPFTVNGRISTDDHPIAAWRSFRNAARQLQSGIDGQTAETVLDRARRNMNDSWTQMHRLRAMGALLTARAAKAGVLAKVGRSMLVTPPKGSDTDKAKTAVLIA